MYVLTVIQFGGIDSQSPKELILKICWPLDKNKRDVNDRPPTSMKRDIAVSDSRNLLNCKLKGSSARAASV